MKQSIRNQSDEVFYEAEYNPEGKWIYARLKGELSLNDIERAAESFLELFKISGVKKLINDTSEVTGDFKRVKHWTVDTKMAELSQLGLDHYAHISKIDPRKIEMITSSMKSQEIEYKVFKNLKKAEKWMLSR